MFFLKPVWSVIFNSSLVYLFILLLGNVFAFVLEKHVACARWWFVVGSHIEARVLVIEIVTVSWLRDKPTRNRHRLVFYVPCTHLRVHLLHHWRTALRCDFRLRVRNLIGAPHDRRTLLKTILIIFSLLLVLDFLLVLSSSRWGTKTMRRRLWLTSLHLLPRRRVCYSDTEPWILLRVVLTAEHAILTSCH